MADITMCEGARMTPMRVQEVCPLREDCYRHKATPNPWRQAYMCIPPWVGKECADYWKMEPPPKPSKRSKDLPVRNDPDTA